MVTCISNGKYHLYILKTFTSEAVLVKCIRNRKYQFSIVKVVTRVISESLLMHSYQSKIL